MFVHIPYAILYFTLMLIMRNSELIEKNNMYPYLHQLRVRPETVTDLALARRFLEILQVALKRIYSYIR